MESCDPVGTLMEIKDKLDLDQNGTPVDATKYRSMIGALMYLTSSRPDIVHATCLCAWYQAKPTEKHLKEDSGFELTGFSDADYAGCKDTFKSTFGGAQFLGEKLVSWSLKKQDCTALSTAEAEYCLYPLAVHKSFNYLVRRLGMRSLSPKELDHLVKTQTFRVILFSIHNDEWKSFQSQHQTALRIRRWRYNLTLAESKFKTPMLDHQDKYMIKAQVHVLKSSAISDTQPLPRRKHYCQIYQVVKHILRGRVLASFQDRDHEGGDKRSQGGEEGQVVQRIGKPEWSRHVTIVHQTKDLHTVDYTQLYDFLKYNQKEELGYSECSSKPKSLEYWKSEWKEEAGIQLQAEEFDLMAAAADLDEIEEVNANCILIANLQQASTSGTQIDKALVYDSDGSAEVHDYENCYDNEIFNMFTQEKQYTELLKPILKPHQIPQNDYNVISEGSSVEQSGETVEQHPVNVEETRALYDSLYHNLAIEVEKVNTVNR
nr:hypothetical protein [Tanacetum cinerariifolium]